MHPNEMPEIISGLGQYETRNGDIVAISRIDPQLSPKTMRFGCKGHFITLNGKKARSFDIWHKSGMYTAFEGKHDIVKKL